MNSDDISLVVSFGAFLVAVYAALTTRNFNKRQLKLIEQQEELNQRQLEEQRGAAEAAGTAKIRASISKIGQSKWQLKVWNEGPAQARNVRVVPVDPENGRGVIYMNLLQHKFPMEYMEKHDSVSVSALVTMGSSSKQALRLIWDDDSETDRERMEIVVI